MKNTPLSQRLGAFIDTIRIVDTHEHHLCSLEFTPLVNRFHGHTLYFPYDLKSSGWSPTADPTAEKLTADQLWDCCGKHYAFTRATSYHAQLIHGYRKLYGYDKLFLTKEDAVELERRVLENYSTRYEEWFDTAFKACRFEIILVDQIREHYSLDYDARYYALVFRINNLVMHVSEAAEKGIIDEERLLAVLGSDPIPVASLDDYLAMIRSVFDVYLARNAVCLKNALAYERSIDFADVTYAEAKELFSSRSLPPDKVKKLQDFVFNHVIERAVEHDLPIQIHTGYLSGNSNPIDQGHPMKLLPLLRRHPRARFVLFHGGYPWTSEFIALGKNYPNVHLDLVWLPQISQTAAMRVLHELLDCVPYNKIGWGGDGRMIEDSAGALEIGKEVVSTVLAERIENGWLTEEVAREMALRIFRENAIDLYRLDEKCGIGQSVTAGPDSGH